MEDATELVKPYNDVGTGLHLASLQEALESKRHKR